MKRKAVFLLIIMLCGIVLSGCGLLTVTSQRMQVGLEPTGNLGYEVSPTGAITITQRNLRFRNAAGANGVYVTGYEIVYFDNNGNPLVPGDSEGNQTAMSIFVPPGLQCLEPDPVLGCTILSDGAYAAPGPEVITVEGFNLLSVGVAELHLQEFMNNGYTPIGWYAEITFLGYEADGNPFVSEPYILHISPPS